ncbi:MAG: apolipoprotein N-acyltransferase [Syntrophaceae bacterium]|nr:apolipoprotein N-acyltransferase [Deltaproteobacteria bacterium]
MKPSAPEQRAVAAKPAVDRWLGILLPAFSGVLYALAFPSFDLWPLAWVFAVPLLFSVEGKRPAPAFFQGMAAGLVAWAGILYWIAFVMNTYGGMNLPTAAVVLLLLLVYLALYFGAFSWAASRLLTTRYAFLTLPGIWIGLEMFKSTVVFSGFPWALLGHSQLPWTSFVQVAELGGVHLISGIVIMGNVAVYKAARVRFAPLAVACLAVVVCVAFGHYRLGHDTFSERPVKAAAAQANVPQDVKWHPERVEPTLDTYSALTRKALAQGAGVIVWPETACTFYLFRQWPQTLRVLDLSTGNDAALVVGSPAYEDDRFFNRAWLLQRGDITGVYDKTHLVPFGEYLPLAWLLKPVFGSLTQEVSDFSIGKEARPMGDIGATICFESIFPDISRTLCINGATLLVNMSNDAWFKTWATPGQHLQIACFRAIETRRWLIRAVNHGISAIVNPYGEIVERIGLLQEGVIVHEVAKNSSLSFYVRYGPLLPLLWGLLALIGALTTLRADAKAKGP